MQSQYEKLKDFIDVAESLSPHQVTIEEYNKALKIVGENNVCSRCKGLLPNTLLNSHVINGVQKHWCNKCYKHVKDEIYEW